MKLIFFGAFGVILGIIVFTAIYWGIVFYRSVQASKILVEKAVAFQNITEQYEKPLLVLGDSTGVGVGAEKPEDTLAALLSDGMNATYTQNLSVSGAIVSDLPKQIERANLDHYHTILVQIGANDIIRFHGVEETAQELGIILDTLTKRSDRVLLMSAGNVGGAIIFPPPLRPFYTTRTLAYHDAFTAVAEEHGATYINLYSPPEKDLFLKDPNRYFAADGLHPSSAGYVLWYERLQEIVTP